MNTIKYATDEVEQSHEAALAIERGMPIEVAEMLVAPIAFEPITEEEVVAVEIPREMAMRLREIEAERAFDRRFGHA